MNGKGIRAALLSILVSLALAACGLGKDNGGSGGASPAALRGSVHGGQSPVSGSTVTLYAAGSGLAGATVLGTTTTNANGSWNLSSFTCPSAAASTYVIASGGNPGLAAGTDNSALQLLAALGPCGGLAGTVNIDEVTTVAAAYALNGFIGPSGCIDCNAGVPGDVSNVHGNSPGLDHAMGNAALLASVGSGSAAAALPSATACAGGSPPANCGAEQRLNALANSLAACVNSSGPTSAQCLELFDCATPGATYSGGACTVPGGSTLAADTLTAILEIARSPAGVPVAGVYDIATRNPVFSPTLGAAPTDWTLALNISGGGLDEPNGIAIDAVGNVWVANQGNSTLSEFSPSGAALSGSSGYNGGGLDSPLGLAIDSGGKVWVINGGNYSLSAFDATGAALSPGGGYTGGGIFGPQGVAVDSGGDVWVTNFPGASLSEFNSAGTPLSGSNGDTGGGLKFPEGIAVDSGGNVWVASNGNSSLSEFNSAGQPLSGSSGYSGGGINGPLGVAIDPSGKVWVTNAGGASLSEFNSAGQALSGSSGYSGGGLVDVQGIAIDAGGNAWVANGNGSVSQFNSAGTPLSPGSGYTGGGLNGSGGVAIDASGDVWVANFSGNSLTVLIGAAAPTRTPLVSAINNGFRP